MVARPLTYIALDLRPVHRVEFFSYHGGCPRVLVSSVILFNGRDLGLRKRSSCLEIVLMSKDRPECTGCKKMQE